MTEDYKPPRSRAWDRADALQQARQLAAVTRMPDGYLEWGATRTRAYIVAMERLRAAIDDPRATTREIMEAMDHMLAAPEAPLELCVQISALSAA